MCLLHKAELLSYPLNAKNFVDYGPLCVSQTIQHLSMVGVNQVVHFVICRLL